MHGCTQGGAFGKVVDWAMYMTKLRRTSSASYSINTHLHSKLRFSTKFIVAKDNPCKSETVSKIGTCGQFAILQAISPLVFDKWCVYFGQWSVVQLVFCVCQFDDRSVGFCEMYIQWWVHVCRRVCTNVCFISDTISVRGVQLICGPADRWQWHLFHQSSKRQIDAERSAPRLAHPSG
jgi:hypothetical protein